MLSSDIDRPWKRDEHVTTYLTILSVYDLNYQPGIDTVLPIGNPRKQRNETTGFKPDRYTGGFEQHIIEFLASFVQLTVTI